MDTKFADWLQWLVCETPPLPPRNPKLDDTPMHEAEVLGVEMAVHVVVGQLNLIQ